MRLKVVTLFYVITLFWKNVIVIIRTTFLVVVTTLIITTTFLVVIRTLVNFYFGKYLEIKYEHKSDSGCPNFKFNFLYIYHFPKFDNFFRESLKLNFLHGSLQAVHTNFHAKSGVCSSKMTELCLFPWFSQV